MLRRTLYFGNPTKLRLENKQLIIRLEEEEVRQVPVEDIGYVVFDHAQITVSHSLIQALLKNNVALLWCDEKHMPESLMLSHESNHLFSKKLKAQLEVSVPFKKQLWKQTIEAKITNQANLIRWLGGNCASLLECRRKVQSGDSGNQEAVASGIYWNELFGSQASFRRNRFGAPPNHLLNYGYAVLRAVVARSLTTAGCFTSFGIFHRNQYNPHCLADDIMEPYRPFVDKTVIEWMEEKGSTMSDRLDKEDKRVLLSIPAMDVNIGGVISPLMVASDKTAQTLMKCYESEIKKITYPVL